MLIYPLLGISLDTQLLLTMRTAFVCKYLHVEMLSNCHSMLLLILHYIEIVSRVSIFANRVHFELRKIVFLTGAVPSYQINKRLVCLCVDAVKCFSRSQRPSLGLRPFFHHTPQNWFQNISNARYCLYMYLQRVSPRSAVLRFCALYKHAKT